MLASMLASTLYLLFDLPLEFTDKFIARFPQLEQHRLTPNARPHLLPAASTPSRNCRHADYTAGHHRLTPDN